MGHNLDSEGGWRFGYTKSTRKGKHSSGGSLSSCCQIMTIWLTLQPPETMFGTLLSQGKLGSKRKWRMMREMSNAASYRGQGKVPVPSASVWIKVSCYLLPVEVATFLPVPMETLERSSCQVGQFSQETNHMPFLCWWRCQWEWNAIMSRVNTK